MVGRYKTQIVRNKQRGFTIVELLIVIVVIGILAAIVIVAYNGVQSRARDSTRKYDIQHLQQSIAMFYAQNNYYPAVQDMTNPTFRANTLQIPEGLVTAPGTTSTIAYCWSNSPNQYCYVGTAATGGSFDCTTAGEHCIGYRISYELESNPSNQIIVSN